MDYLKQYINKKTLNRNIVTIVTIQAKMREIPAHLKSMRQALLSVLCKDDNNRLF